MKLLTIIVILKIIFTVVTIEATVVENQLTTRDYADFIEDIYQFTKSSSVTLIHFTKDGNLIQKNKIFQMQKLLLKKRIIFDISDINLRLTSNLTDERFHNFKGLRKDNLAISFFFLTSMEDFREMKKYSRLLSRTNVINFVLFMKNNDKNYSTICQNPKGNEFGLNDGVSILVKCWTNVMIKEWHTINNNLINIIPRATWEPERNQRFILESKKLKVGNREAIKGKVLRAVIIKESRTIGEYFPKLIEALENAGNFTFSLIEKEERGIYYENNKTWSGAMGLIVNKQFDIALGWFTYLPNGFSNVDYTVTIDRAEFVILIKEPKPKTVISWTAFFQPFTSKTWLVLLFLFIIIQTICVFLKKKTHSHSGEQTTAADDFFYICGIFLHKYQPNISQEASIRIFYISVIIFSFYIWSIYSAAFVSKLTIIDRNVPFKSLEEFTRVKSHKMIVFQDTLNYYKLKNAKHPLLRKAKELLVSDDELPKTNEAAIEMICNNEMALFTDDMFLSIAYNNSIPNICRMVTIRTNEFNSFGLILSKNSPYTSSINYYLRRFLNNGVMSRLKSILAESIPTYLENKPENKHTSVHFIDIVLLLTILIGNVFISTVILFLEKLHFSFRRAKEA